MLTTGAYPPTPIIIANLMILPKTTSNTRVGIN